jgi:hypothetical protein
MASVTIAHAAEQALVGSPWWAGPAQQGGQAPRVASALTSRSTVVHLSSVDDRGTQVSVVCLTTPDRVSADDLAINPEDMATVIANLCMSAARLDVASTADPR